MPFPEMGIGIVRRYTDRRRILIERRLVISLPERLIAFIGQFFRRLELLFRLGANIYRES